MNRFVSRFVYTTCYTVSYGVVFPSVLVARSIPKNNPIVHGLVDGAHAAVDMVDEMKKRKLEAPQGEPAASGGDLMSEGRGSVRNRGEGFGIARSGVSRSTPVLRSAEPSRVHSLDGSAWISDTIGIERSPDPC